MNKLIFLVEECKQISNDVLKYLKESGYEIRHFSTQNDLLTAFINEQPFAIILNHLLCTTGSDVEELVKKLKGKSNYPPSIIVISADSNMQIRLSAAHAGISHFFDEPVNPHALIQCIKNVSRSRYQAPPNILFIEDEKHPQGDYHKILTQAGMKVDVLTNFLKLPEVLNHFKPDVILIDLHLVNDSGLEIARVIRQSSAWRHKGIIFLADQANIDQQNSAINLGADAVLIKPIAPSNLISIVKNKAMSVRLSVNTNQDLKHTLRENEFQNIALNEHAIVSTANTAGNITSMNDKFCEASGYSREELLGKNHRILKSGYHSPAFYKTMWNTIRKGNIWHGIICNKTKTGRYYWVQSTIVPFINAQGIPYKFVSIRTDISKLRTNEERLSLSQTFANIGSWDWDIKTGELYYSKEMSAILGYTNRISHTTINNFMSDSVHPDDQPLVMDKLFASLKNGNKFDLEYRIIWPEGCIRWVHTLGDIVRDGEGNPLHTIGVTQDISERKATQLALLEQEQRLVEAQRIGRIGDWSWDFVTGKTHWSGESLRLLGHPSETNPTYARVMENIHPEDILRAQGDDQVTIRSGYSASDYRIKRLDGEFRWVHIERYSVVDESGTPTGLRGTIQDISERKLSEYSLIAAKEEAEKANRAKSEFLSSISHELRTPLNAILGFSQLLQMDEEPLLSRQQHGYAGEIINAGSHLLNLINEILDLAKIESGHFNLSIEPVDVDDVIDDCLELIKPLAQDNNITIDWKKGGTGLPTETQLNWNGKILSDHTRLKQILLNILSNAIKYNSENGKVIISYSLVADKHLLINITDSGSGMSLEQQSQLFQVFNRLGAENTHIEGVGMGLVISKNIAEQMGGHINVESQPGKGTTFQIQMPLATTQSNASISHPEGFNVGITEKNSGMRPLKSDSKQYSVLYIEDNPTNQRLISLILRQKSNINLLCASEPVLGLELAETHKPDLILLDINLPGMDGFELLQRLRRQDANRNTSIIALSANAMSHEIKKGLEAGFDRYITKPVEAQAFLEIVEDTLQNSQSIGINL